MNAGWTLYIAVFSIANILACWWLIRFATRPRANEAAKGEVTGHVWDDDLAEYNNPLPRWWLWMFYGTIIFGLLYLVLYPGLGGFKGVLGWSQVGAYEAEVSAVEADTKPLFDGYAQTPIIELAGNPEAMATGRRLFVANCAVCHGSDGRGAQGFPNLADKAWNWGGTPEAIVQSISAGRMGVMPPWGQVLGEDGVEETAHYVLSLGGNTAADAAKAEAGAARFAAMCSSCHGAEGTGNPMLGAPDLTDGDWLYGSSLDAVRASIAEGRQGQMPAHKDVLNPARIHVLGAYVYGLSGNGQ